MTLITFNSVLKGLDLAEGNYEVLEANSTSEFRGRHDPASVIIK